jgi:signal transduction histidine kinase
VEIQVTDTGIGLSPEALCHVFEQFWQANRDSVARGDRGAGLGLAIAHSLIAAHGGTIEAASRGKGQGSSFTVRLPLAGRRAAATSSAAW